MKVRRIIAVLILTMMAFSAVFCENKEIRPALAKSKIKVTIKAGDIMLYGSNCIVVFYKSFDTTYKYTRIGRITKTKGLKKALGEGRIKVRFSKK